MKFIKFNGVELPDHDGEYSAPIGARSSLVKLVNGAFDSDGDSVYLDPGKLRYRATPNGTYGTFETGELIDELVQIFSTSRGVLTAERRDGSQVATWVKMTDITRMVEAEMNDIEQPISITLEQPYPYWIAKDDIWFFDDDKIFDGGLDFDGNTEEQTVNSSPFLFTITNGGTAPVPMGVLTFVPQSGGSMTNILVRNTANNLGFRWYGNIGYGDMLQIEFLSKTITLNGENAFASLQPASETQIPWMVLVVGDNPIEILAEDRSGNTDLYWSWARHYF